MAKNSPIGIFLAAAAALSTNAIIPNNSMAGEKHSDMGGLRNGLQIKKQTKMESLTKLLKKLLTKLKRLTFAFLSEKEKIAGKS